MRKSNSMNAFFPKHHIFATMTIRYKGFPLQMCVNVLADYMKQWHHCLLSLVNKGAPSVSKSTITSFLLMYEVN